jgi:ABC-2 type transport system permease protein
MQLKPASWPWLLRHEIRLAWHSAGQTKAWIILGLGGAFWLAYHAAAFGVLKGLDFVSAKQSIKASTFVLWGSVALWASMTVMLSYAITLSVSALFDRGDLDLLFSSPIPPRTVMTVRCLGVAFSIGFIYVLLGAPFAHVGIFTGRPQLLAVYPATIAIALLVTAIGMLATLSLVRVFGARRAKTIGQVLGAVVGALAFLLTQVQSFLSARTRNAIQEAIGRAMSPGGWLTSEGFVSVPLRAMLGEPVPLLLVMLVGVGAFIITMNLTSRRFVEGTQESVKGSASSRSVAVSSSDVAKYFRSGVLRNVLVKEWRMIARDPQLIAQTLLQVLYMMPLAFVALRSKDALFGAVPSTVFLASWLAGNLAWITVTAEDAPELVGTAPLDYQRVRRMKAYAAVIPVWFLALPVVITVMLKQPLWAIPMILCVAGGTLAAGLMQVWVPRTAKRADLKNRGKSDVLLSFLEFLSAAAWAATAAMLISNFSWKWAVAAVTISVALLMALIAWLQGASRRAQGVLVE